MTIKEINLISKILYHTACTVNFLISVYSHQGFLALLLLVALFVWHIRVLLAICNGVCVAKWIFSIIRNRIPLLVNINAWDKMISSDLHKQWNQWNLNWSIFLYLLLHGVSFFTKRIFICAWRKLTYFKIQSSSSHNTYFLWIAVFIDSSLTEAY